MKFRNSSLLRLLLVLLILTAGCNDEESRRQLDIVRQIAADTPLYPGFVQLRSSDYHKTSHVGLIRCYSVRANDGDIRRFYSEVFAVKGWTLAEEQKLGGFHPEGSYRLTFRKGAYAIVLGHDNLADPAGECNYSLAYYWSPPEPLINLTRENLKP